MSRSPGTPPTPGNASFTILDEVTLCAQSCGLDLERVRELAEFARQREQPLVEILTTRGGVDEQQLLSGLAQRLDLPYLGDPAHAIAPDVLAMASPAVAIRYHVIPLAQHDGRLDLACCDPFNWQQWDELQHLLNGPIGKVLCPTPVIDALLKRHYGLGADTVEHLVAGREDEPGAKVISTTTTDLSEEEAANEPTVVNLVNRILTEAIRAGATDIHFEPYESRYRVRYRIDGMLEDVSIPVSVHLLKLALISRIKIMSSLDITEKRLPQDGRSQVKLAGHDYDLRVSILPGVYGEAVVIRLQSRQMVKLDLDALGYNEQAKAKIIDLIARPHGLVLVTGPTGSGKTTTLYTCLSRINKPDTKIITIEDPVEYWMEDILQMQVHEEIGFSFARALRGMLRHDPDVMLVGEIRDRKTADIAIRCALTGHLVFATLHTNDAASGITRLLDIGIEPFLLASSIHGIIAQRLIRRVCEKCAQPADSDELTEIEAQMLTGAGVVVEGATFRRGRGCDACRFTGYRGRTAAAEVLLVSTALRRLIQQREPAEQIKQLAEQEGMQTLRSAATQAAAVGVTDTAEVTRVTQEDVE